jgi:hypothetical protein
LVHWAPLRRRHLRVPLGHARRPQRAPQLQTYDHDAS